MSTNLIIADMQRFKVYEVQKDPVGRESVKLVRSIDSIESHERIHDKVSDQLGNFQGVGASESGENHNMVLEEERRRIKEIASQVTEALNDLKPESWSFAAPKAINNHIIEQLDSSYKASLAVNLHSDLTKTPDDELLEHFNK